MLRAVDLFAGAGGATQGLRNAGYDVVAAVEFDPDAAATWRANHPGIMLEADVRSVSAQMLMQAGGFQKGELDLLKACPPCQGFSTLRGGKIPDSARNDLVLDTLRFVRELMPRAVLLENVPGLRRDARFDELVKGLREVGYSLRDYIVDAQMLGVPQRRRRLVLIAILGDQLDPPPLSELWAGSLATSMTAGEMLAIVDEYEHETAHPVVDTPRLPKGTVAERIAAIPVDGNRFDLPVHLQLDCHKGISTKSGRVKRSATGSYGRVRAGAPAPTMTTRCTTPACGSFIHPTLNRGLTLREASAFQTFPLDYEWVGNYGSVERQIGNAVPVLMAAELGRAVRGLLESTSSVVAR